jgi:hypothetical protein
MTMQLSPLFLEKLQQAELIGEAREAQSLILRLLDRRVGNISIELQERVKSLSLERLEDLGEALLDFTNLAELEAWLSQN